jgi:hypothetical protein
MGDSKAKRTCLMCNEEFDSVSKFNRRCPSCHCKLCVSKHLEDGADNTYKSKATNKNGRGGLRTHGM